MNRPVILVVGAGPGVSGAVARRFAAHGYDVGLIGLDSNKLNELDSHLGTFDVEVCTEIVDITDREATASAIERLGTEFGSIDVLHFNPSAYRAKDPLSLTVPELLADVELGVGALLTAVQAAHPFMGPGSKITATGSMAADEPAASAASLGVQKAGLRNLVYSIDKTLAPDIRAVSVTVRGVLATEGPFTPTGVAEAIWAAANRSEQDWTHEVAYDGS